ncbi:hypothetical protein FACS1894162_5820 [Bacteroidia bacterium]|nr:hypothetical protein FACS1894162_5820 [Bacteroidia bacterium]
MNYYELKISLISNTETNRDVVSALLELDLTGYVVTLVTGVCLCLIKKHYLCTRNNKFYNVGLIYF